MCIAAYFPLREEPILKLGKLHGCGAGFVVVRHVIDPRADGIAPHQPGIKKDGHAVVDG
jgi:hypothetical protein